MSDHGNSALAARQNTRGEKTNAAARRFTPKRTPLTEEQVRAADARARARTAKMDALAAKPPYDLTSKEFLQLQNRYKTTERNPFTGTGRAVTRHATSASAAETLHLSTILDHLEAGGVISPTVYESLPSASRDRLARDFPQQTRDLARAAATARLAKTGAKGQSAAAPRVTEATRHETAAAAHAVARDARGVSIADAHLHEGLRAYHARAADDERALARTDLSAAERRERLADLKALNADIPRLEARLAGAKPAAAAQTAPKTSGRTARSSAARSSAAGRPREAQPGEQITPRSGPDLNHFNPYATTTLAQLRQWYGEDQLGAALSGGSITHLRAMAKANGLSAGGSKAALVSRLTSHATEGRYTADFAKPSGPTGASRPATRGARAPKYELEPSHPSMVIDHNSERPYRNFSNAHLANEYRDMLRAQYGMFKNAAAEALDDAAAELHRRGIFELPGGAFGPTPVLRAAPNSFRSVKYPQAKQP